MIFENVLEVVMFYEIYYVREQNSISVEMCFP